MTVRALTAGGTPGGASGWQTILADLSLILFMVTASALAYAPDAPLQPDPAPAAAAAAKPAPAPTPAPSPQPVAASPEAEPVALWRDAPDAPPLEQWLAEQAADPRLRITIVVRHLASHRAEAFARAERLTQAAGPRGAVARLVIEQGAADGASVAVGYDTEETGTAAGTPLAGKGA